MSALGFFVTTEQAVTAPFVHGIPPARHRHMKAVHAKYGWTQKRENKKGK